jgi:hypothetical protein
MLTTTEVLRIIGDAETDLWAFLTSPIVGAIRLGGELLVAILTPALIDRHARRSSRVLK